MEPIGREHAAPCLPAHEREEIDVARPGTLRDLAHDSVVARDLARDRRAIAEVAAHRRERPVRLRERDDVDAGERVEDAYELARVALLRVAGSVGTANRRDEVVRADEHRRERGTEGRDERELLADEVVGRVAVHRGVPQLDLATALAPQSNEHRGERAIRCRAGADGERVTEREVAFGNTQLF